MQDSNPSDADLKQMYAYNHYFDCGRSYLVYYPKVYDIKSPPGSYAPLKDFRVHGCGVMFVDVVDGDGRLNRNLGEEVFKVINHD